MDREPKRDPKELEEELIEGAGIGEDFEPKHPARDLDTADLNAAAAAGEEIVREELVQTEGEEEQNE
jgi:hypothetical protein